MGSSKVPMSASVEFANVGTPRNRTVLRAGALPAGGAAGIGAATDAARIAAMIAFPNCFNVGTSVLITRPPIISGGVVFTLRKILGQPLKCRFSSWLLPSRIRRFRRFTLHPAVQQVSH